MLKLSIELLYHYQCDRCHKWWSVADITPTPNTIVYCPHCGSKHVVPSLAELHPADSEPTTKSVMLSDFKLDATNLVQVVGCKEPPVGFDSEVIVVFEQMNHRIPQFGGTYLMSNYEQLLEIASTMFYRVEFKSSNRKWCELQFEKMPTEEEVQALHGAKLS